MSGLGVSLKTPLALKLQLTTRRMLVFHSIGMWCMKLVVKGRIGRRSELRERARAVRKKYTHDKTIYPAPGAKTDSSFAAHIDKTGCCGSTGPHRGHLTVKLLRWNQRFGTTGSLKNTKIEHLR